MHNCIITLKTGKVDHDNLRTSLQDENILAPTLLRLEEIMFFELNTTIETLRRDEGISCYANRREILNDKFLDIWISKFQNRSVN